MQPTVQHTHEKIEYREHAPCKEIDNFIYCFWQLKNKKKLQEPFVYRVVSDGCIDFFFNHKQPSENFILGFCRKYTEFPIEKEFDYIGIRFFPAVVPILFGVDAKNLSNQSHELTQILPEFSNWLRTNLRQEQSFVDKRFLNSLHLIFQKKGFLDIETDLNAGVSSRQLRRIYNFYIGTTPKVFSNVVRFQYILNAKPSIQDLRENKFYYDVGFFDQAHFIKNFKTFYGVTPSEAFG